MIATIPAVFPLAFAVAMLAVLPRNLGHLVAALAAVGVTAQAVFMPAGPHLATTFLGFEVIFQNIDQFSRLMGIIFGFITVLAVTFAWGSDTPKRTTALAVSYVTATFGAVYAGDWLVLIFWWELMAVTSTVLVWARGGAAIRSGYRYALFHGIGGTLLLAAVIVHFANTGTFIYAATGIDPAATVLAALGIGVNCGFIFLHSWLPDAYPSPHFSASVFMSVFTTKTAVYTMYRAFPEGGLWLAYLGGLMTVYGAAFALMQYDPRRLLSYHIQGQVGYMLAGVGLAGAVGDLAVAGGFAHVFNHVIYKSLLFMVVGVIIYRTGIEDIRDMGGLWRVMPVTFVVYLVASASIASVPGFNGFISKGMIIDSAHDFADPAAVGGPEVLLGEGLLWWLLIIGGVGTFLSFIKLGYYMFFHGTASVDPPEATPLQMGAMAVAGVSCVALGVFWESLLVVIPFSAEVIPELKPYSMSHIVESMALMVSGFVGFFALRSPLATLSHYARDIDSLLYPAAFYTTRGFVWGVTELWAFVDRATMRLAAASVSVGTNPRTVAARMGVGPELRAGIGRSVFVLTALVAAVLGVLLFG